MAVFLSWAWRNSGLWWQRLEMLPKRWIAGIRHQQPMLLSRKPLNLSQAHRLGASPRFGEGERMGLVPTLLLAWKTTTLHVPWQYSWKSLMQPFSLGVGWSGKLVSIKIPWSQLISEVHLLEKDDFPFQVNFPCLASIPDQRSVSLGSVLLGRRHKESSKSTDDCPHRLKGVSNFFFTRC